MKTNWRYEAPQLLLIAGMLVWGAVAYIEAPPRLPIHWNAAGEVNGYGGPFLGTLFLPLLAAGIYLLFRYLPAVYPSRDPRRNDPVLYGRPYAVIRTAVFALLAAIYGLTQAVGRGYDLPMGRILPLLLSALLLVIAGPMRQLPSNDFVGLRLPRGCTPESWARSQHLCSRFFVAAGLLGAVAAVALPVGWGIGVLVGTLMLGTPWVVAFAYRADRAGKNAIAVEVPPPDPSAPGGSTRGSPAPSPSASPTTATRPRSTTGTGTSST